MAAARALHSQSRFVFFEDGETTGVKALRRSDRNAISSVMSVVHADDDETLRDNIVDFQDKAAKLVMKKDYHEGDEHE